MKNKMHLRILKTFPGEWISSMETTHTHTHVYILGMHRYHYFNTDSDTESVNDLVLINQRH